MKKNILIASIAAVCWVWVFSYLALSQTSSWGQQLAAVTQSYQLEKWADIILVTDNLWYCGDWLVDNNWIDNISWTKDDEQCDDGNMVNDDWCNNICKIEVILSTSVCGNGILEDWEQCDDGNLEDWDGCNYKCSFEESTCGNWIIEFPEECDDGDNNDVHPDVDGDGVLNDDDDDIDGDGILNEFDQDPYDSTIWINDDPWNDDWLPDGQWWSNNWDDDPSNDDPWNDDWWPDGQWDIYPRCTHDCLMIPEAR